MLYTSIRTILFSLCKLAMDCHASFPIENAHYFEASTNFDELDSRNLLGFSIGIVVAATVH